MKLITERIEDIQCITEAKDDGKKSYYIEGVFMQGNVRNRNGRIYPQETLMKETKRYVTEKVSKNRAYGELGHPQGPTINLERVSHLIKELKEDGTNVYGKAKIMESTPYGKIVTSLIDEGASLGVSSRGMGSLKEKNGVMEVQNDFFLATPADIVADPSAPEAFVQGIMEGAEWVFDNGGWKKIDVMREEMRTKSAKQIEEEAFKYFEKFINSIS